MSAPTRVRPVGLGQGRLDWSPWVAPLERADADAEQLEAIDAPHGDFPYYRVLTRAVRVFRERTAADHAIFQGAGGLPRAERELSAAAASRVNGCQFCASVHSHFASRLSKRPDDVQRVLDDGAEADLDPRWKAIVTFATALSTTPPSATAAHVDALRGVGLDELEILDVAQSAAFFAWANRLMLTLGEPSVSEQGWGDIDRAVDP